MSRVGLGTVGVPSSPSPLRAAQVFRVGRGPRNMYALRSCPAVATGKTVGLLAKPCSVPFAVFFV